jgi:hypothetical protein
MIKRYVAYLVRWQLSTPILAPIVAAFKHSASLFGTAQDWIGASVANLVGGLIFFWVNSFIFSSRALASEWEIRENVNCVDCKKLTRGYRLVKAKNYDRSAALPEFRCEECSTRKSEQLKKKGVKVE